MVQKVQKVQKPDWETRFEAMEKRLSQLEEENARLSSNHGEEKKELSSLEVVRIKELARDVQRYGFDAAMEMHGRKTYKRGRTGGNGALQKVVRKK